MKFVIEKEEPEKVCVISFIESMEGVDVFAKLAGNPKQAILRISEKGVMLFHLYEDVGIMTDDKEVKII